MNKKIFIFCAILVVFFAFLYYFHVMSPNASSQEKKYPYGEGVSVTVIHNEKYGFSFSYPEKYYPIKADEWDNGLPGSKDGGVYGFRATGGNMGQFTSQINVNVYNLKINEYLAKLNTNYKHSIRDVKEFGEEGKRITTMYGTSGKLLTGTVSDDCELLFEHNNLLFIVDCKIKQFKFID